MVARALTLAAFIFGLLAVGSASGKAVLDGGPGGRSWDPGMVLVRFRDATTARQRAHVADADGLRILEHLPLVPELYRLEVPPGKRVESAIGRLAKNPLVLYAQPDSFASDKTFTTGPRDKAYWPSDPAFWSQKFGNPNGCERFQSRLAQWYLWPLGTNLSDALSPVNVLGGPNPLPDGQRALRTEGYDSYYQYYSINVLPVWALLRDAGRLTDRKLARTPADQPAWSENELSDFGIGVVDTGLSDNTDIKSQVAALFSTATLEPSSDTQGPSQELVREVYRDNPARPDIETIKTNGSFSVQDANRPLFALDDTNVLAPDEWKPKGPLGGLQLPGGCDGHGTGVASAAAATTGNGEGLAGVAYDAPLVGVRVGEPWDAPGVDYARDDRLSQAMEAWKQQWKSRARGTDEDMIKRLAILRALKIPVVNASMGRKMFFGVQGPGNGLVPEVTDPALVEAWADLFTSGSTLGVVAAGNDKERYGTGPSATGAELYLNSSAHPVDLPCGLPLLRTRRTFVEEDGRPKPYLPDIAWNRLALLCVAATTSNDSQLASYSGWGTSSVEIAAPGSDIVAASRPRARNSGGVDPNVYANTSGTSLAAPLVAGAASLLRQAAPAAPIREITAALRNGARPVLPLLGKVGYGQLDVACSLDWLAREARRRGADWGIVDVNSNPDFVAATKTCAVKLPRAVTATHEIAKTKLFAADNRHASFEALLASKGLSSTDTSKSLAWQNALLRGQDLSGRQTRVIFAIGSQRAEVPSGGSAIYDGGTLQLACPQEGFRLTRLRVDFGNSLHPDGWSYPTDLAPPPRGVEFGIGIKKPWFSGVLPSVIKVTARGVCEYLPNLG